MEKVLQMMNVYPGRTIAAAIALTSVLFIGALAAIAVAAKWVIS